MARQRLRIKKKNPLIVICSEGGKKSSEYYYFSNFASRELRIQFSTGNSTDPLGMLNDLQNYIKNEDIESEDEYKIFMVLDTDLSKDRIDKIKKVMQQCKKDGIEVVISSPTFEIWYLMHFLENGLIFKSSKEVKKEVKKHIPNYIESMNVYNKIKDKLDFAIDTAKKYEQQAKRNQIDLFDCNPYTSIYKIIDSIRNMRRK